MAAMNASPSLLRDPFGRPATLPDFPGLNWLACCRPVFSGSIAQNHFYSPASCRNAFLVRCGESALGAARTTHLCNKVVQQRVAFGRDVQVQFS